MGEGEAGTRVSMDASRIRSRLCPATSRLITVTKVAAQWAACMSLAAMWLITVTKVAAQWAACMGLAAMWLMSVQHRLLSWTGRRHSVPPSSAPRIELLWMSMCEGTLALLSLCTCRHKC